MTQSKFKSPHIIVALDVDSSEKALTIAKTLDPQRCRIKIGKELFTRCGTPLVKRLIDQGFSIFLDLKYHDIPNTVAQACLAAADLGVWMVNVHTLGGPKMMAAAADKLAALSGPKPLLIGVTILTSHSQQDLADIGLQGSIVDNVSRLALSAKNAGLDGVVCSAQEAQHLKSVCGNDFCLVTPGIRLQAVENDDQSRVMTPAKAIQAGADYLVIGRPITQAADPIAVIDAIETDINS